MGTILVGRPKVTGIWLFSIQMFLIFTSFYKENSTHMNRKDHKATDHVKQ
jgi:hypothetical protein